MMDQQREGTWHVMSRGWHRGVIFADEEDRQFFVDKLAEKAQDGGVPILSFCLMPNHFHVLLRAGKEALAKLMLRVKTVYSRRHNRRQVQEGTLFENRYVSVPVLGPRNVAYVTAYIHANPVFADIVDEPECYRWSSARWMNDDGCNPPWIDARSVREAARVYLEKPDATYGEFMELWLHERESLKGRGGDADGCPVWIRERRVQILRQFFARLHRRAEDLAGETHGAREMALTFGVWQAVRSRLVDATDVAQAAGFQARFAPYKVRKRFAEGRNLSSRQREVFRELEAQWPAAECELRDLVLQAFYPSPTPKA